MLTTLRNAQKPQSKTDLYETVKIPVREEFLRLTGSMDLAVLLNQIAYSNKERMTIDDIIRLSLFDHTKQTLRKKLDLLEAKGLIKKSQRKNMYGRYYYAANEDIYPNDNKIITLIEGLDLKQFPCYLTASILNKFRQFALSDVEKVQISANELRQMLQSEKSIGLVRLILKRLVAQNYLKETLRGGIYEYEINAQKFVNTFNPEELEEQTNKLTNIFANYLKITGQGSNPQKKNSIKLSIKRMLSDGLNYNNLQQIFAYVGTIQSDTPPLTLSTIKKRYEELSELAFEKLSRRKALRYIYKLLNGLISVKKPDVAADGAQEPANVPIKDDTSLWQEAYQIVNSRMALLKKWYYNQNAGVTDIDFEDYVQQAAILMFNRLKNPNKHNNFKTLNYRLSDYMYHHRHVDKDIKRGKSNVGNIVQFFEDDVSEIIERINVTAEEEIENKSNLNMAILAEGFKHLDARTLNIIKDYHGFEGKSYTFVELAKKYNLKSVGYISTLYNEGIKKLQEHIKPPPD